MGYITRAIWGVLNTFREGDKISTGPQKNGHIGDIPPTVWAVPKASKRGTKSAVAHKWAHWLHDPSCIGVPQSVRAGNKMGNGPQVLGGITLAIQGSPTLESTGQNQQWPTSGHIGCITRAVLGVTNTSQRGTKSAAAHRRANWLHNAYRLGVAQRFIAGDKISSGPQAGTLATRPLPSRGSPKASEWVICTPSTFPNTTTFCTNKTPPPDILLTRLEESSLDATDTCCFIK